MPRTEVPVTMGCRVRSVAASRPALVEMREDEPPGARDIGADMTACREGSANRSNTSNEDDAVDIMERVKAGRRVPWK